MMDTDHKLTLCGPLALPAGLPCGAMAAPVSLDNGGGVAGPKRVEAAGRFAADRVRR